MGLVLHPERMIYPCPTKRQVVEEFRCRAIRDAAMRVVGRRGARKRRPPARSPARPASAKGTLYLYFRSRDEIIEKTIGAAVDDLLERLQRAADGDGPTVRPGARTRPHSSVRLFRRKPRLLPTLLRFGRVLGGPPAAPEPPLPPPHRPARRADHTRMQPGRAEGLRFRAGGHRDCRRRAGLHSPAPSREDASSPRPMRASSGRGPRLGPRGRSDKGLKSFPVQAARRADLSASGSARRRAT